MTRALTKTPGIRKLKLWNQTISNGSETQRTLLMSPKASK